MDRQKRLFGQDDHAQHIQRFLQFVKTTKAQVSGVRPSQFDSTIQSKCPLHFQNDCFVPTGAIRDHFESVQTIRSILEDLYGHHSDDNVSPRTISEEYLKVFSILLAIGQGHWIAQFIQHSSLKDEKLPFLSKPDSFPATTGIKDQLWEAFKHEQWHFCGWYFEAYHINTQIEQFRILPIVKWEFLGRGSSATVFKVWLHPDYHALADDHTQAIDQAIKQQVFVIKSFDASDERRRQCFEKEVNAFGKLKCDTIYGPANIVRFYGSFIQNNTYNIILEYADRATLEHYFKTTQPPRKQSDIHDFWKSLIPIIEGVAKMHKVEQSGETIGVFQGYHQDLKPANILIFSNGNKSPYQFTAKIADLGLSHFIAAECYLPSASGRGAPGTRTYGSPESYRAMVESGERLVYGQASDVWSLAAILSVAATWVVGGTDFLQRYADERRQARIDAGLQTSDCFHDDNQVLAVVEEWHCDLVNSASRGDTITEDIWDHALHQAFSQRVETRLSTPQLSSACVDVISGTVRRNGIVYEDPYARAHTQGSESWGSSNDYGNQPSSPLSPPQNSNSSRQSSQFRRSYNSVTITSPQHRSLPYTAQEGRSTQEPQAVAHTPSTMAVSNSRGAGPWTPPRRSKYNVETSPTARKSHQTAVPERTRSYRALNSGDSEHPIFGANETPLHMASRQHTQEFAVDTAKPVATQVLAQLASPQELISDDDQIAVKEPCPVHDKEKVVDRMTVQQLYAWKVARDNKKPCSIPHDGHLNTLRGRDHVFLIDDAASMKPYWEEVVSLFSALAKFVKECDDDGIELYMTVDKTHLESKTTTPLVNKVKSLASTLNATSEPGDVLRRIFDDHKKSLLEGKRARLRLSRNPAPLSIYFFTDAKWRKHTNLSGLIKDIVEFLEKHNHVPKHVGIQFIQFGTGQTAKDKLHYYDEELGLVRDIVDAELSAGNVWKMLLGAIDRSFDEAECNCNEESVER